MSTTSDDAGVGGSEAFTLRDGVTVMVRPIQPDDAPRLQGLFDRLSERSIFLRFLGHRRVLTRQQADHLANVDYRTRMAFVASLEESSKEKIIAVARYATFDGGPPDQAEAAIVVEDRFQKQGLGTHLLERLVDYGRARGIRAFVAAVHGSNAQIMRFIQRSGLPANRRMQSGVWQVEILLESSSET
jgi:acetyltransferase